jgi:outer membrane protein assembly factor BamB
MRSAVRKTLVLATMACAAIGLGASPAMASHPAVAYQLNPGHSGATPDGVSAAPNELWDRHLGGPVSYPLIARHLVYVTVGNSGSGTTLYAFNASTGTTAWGPVDLGGGSPWSGLAYDSGAVFTLNAAGILEAFDASSGAVRWVTELPSGGSFTAPPTARAGYVYIGAGGDGGTVYAVRESTGKLAWTAGFGGDHSSPAVSAHGVYLTFGCGWSYDFAPLTGKLIWSRSTDCLGGGGSTPALANGRLYVRDSFFAAVLSAGAGRMMGPFQASGPIPAVDAERTYALEGDTLTATSLSSGFDVWTFAGDGKLDSAPIVAGATVLVGSASGTLYGVSTGTGALLWSRDTGASITRPDEYNIRLLPGIASSGGLIVVSASTTLVAYR